MIRKMAASDSNRVRVSFELPSCVWADRIYLVGDFNHWDGKATPMLQDRDGVWRAVVDLPRGGSYEFRYLIDGQWISDSHADGFAHNQFGVSNSIVHATLPVSTFPATDSHVKESHVREIVPMRSVVTPYSHMTFPTRSAPERVGVKSYG